MSRKRTKKNEEEYVLPLSAPKAHNLINEMINGKHGNHGREMGTIFECCILLLLRASDMLKLKYADVFNRNGTVKKSIYSRDVKTDKVNVLYLGKCNNVLLKYHDWLKKNQINSKWLFPAVRNTDNKLSRYTYYKFVKRVANFIGYHHVGTHTARKTGARFIYEKHKDIELVMHLLNQSSQRITERYINVKGKPETDALSDLSNEFDR